MYITFLNSTTVRAGKPENGLSAELTTYLDSQRARRTLPDTHRFIMMAADKGFASLLQDHEQVWGLAV